MICERLQPHVVPPSPVVRVPEEISGTQFPCFVDAADGAPLLLDPYTGEPQGHAIPMREAEVADIYLATKPGVLGAGHRVIYAVITPTGIAMVDTGRKQEGDDTPDLHQTEQRKLYRKLERQRKQGW
jgi:hypothetical protein